MNGLMLSEYCDMSAYLSDKAISECRLDFASVSFQMSKKPPSLFNALLR